MFVTDGIQIMSWTEKGLGVQKVWKFSSLLGYSINQSINNLFSSYKDTEYILYITNLYIVYPKNTLE